MLITTPKNVRLAHIKSSIIDSKDTINKAIKRMAENPEYSINSMMIIESHLKHIEKMLDELVKLESEDSNEI